MTKIITINDWRINRDLIPHFDEKLEFLAFENNTKTHLVLIHSIKEVRMCLDVGLVAVFSNKQKPILYQDIQISTPIVGENHCLWVPGTSIFLIKQFAIDKNGGSPYYPILLIDSKKKRFALINIKNYNNIEIDPLNADKINLYKKNKLFDVAQKVTFNIKSLDWSDFKFINNEFIKSKIENMSN